MDTFHGVGRLTADPISDATANGTPTASFRIAIDATKDHTDFLPVKVYGDYANTIIQYASKGRLVEVAGRVNQNTWSTQEGENRERLEIVARTVRFLDRNPNAGSEPAVPVEGGEPF